MKILISRKTGLFYYYNEISDFHCKEGTIKEEELKSGKTRLISNTNREFIFVPANNYDITQKYKRGPQLITPKDLGYIAARTGIDKNSTIVEAGAGSGGATCFFAKIVNKVLSYELREDHCDVVKKNLKLTGADNVELINKDIADEIENLKDIDLLLLDMPNPSLILDKNLDAIKLGHYIVCYVPSISQVQEITKTIAQSDTLYLEEITEMNMRHWKVWEMIARPEFQKEIDHTAFLVFIRKI